MYALLKNNTFIKIHKFIIDENTNQELTVGKIVRTTSLYGDNYPLLRKCTGIEMEDTVVNTSDIHRICVFLKTADHLYISALPNLYHY